MAMLETVPRPRPRRRNKPPAGLTVGAPGVNPAYSVPAAHVILADRRIRAPGLRAAPLPGRATPGRMPHRSAHDRPQGLRSCRADRALLRMEPVSPRNLRDALDW